jgi:OOP family OmpA-OmpF porin
VVHVEQSPTAILAAVIRGTITPELNSLLQRTLEQIYYDYRIPLLDFKGDTTAFQSTRPLLEACLKKEKKASSHHFQWIVLLIFLSLMSIAGYWVLKQYQQHQAETLRENQWHEFIKEAETLPGIVITHTHFKNGIYTLSGLKDPNALDPLILAPKFNIDPDKVSTSWKQILSLEPELIYKRALNYLSPPETVTLKLADNILIATGQAHHNWIQDANARWTAINGIQRFNTDNLTNIELEEFNNLVQKIEALNIFFNPSEAIPIAGQESIIYTIIAHLKKINLIAETLQRQVSLEIIGHTDPIGSREMNDNLSLTRANKVMSMLVLEEPPPIMFTPIGVGSSLPVISPQAAQNPNASPRRVSFRLKWMQNEP